MPEPKEKKTKSGMSERDFMELVKRVVPAETNDTNLSVRILGAIEDELRRKAQSRAFSNYCQKCVLPNLEPETIKQVEQEMKENFGVDEVSLKVDEKSGELEVAIELNDIKFTNALKVETPEEAMKREEGELPFIAFPVALETDPELVWMLGKRENLSAEEAAIRLEKAHGDFWASKAGQKLLRKRVERNFNEFIGRVPAKLLAEVGLKRLLKDPEPLKVVRPPKE